MTDLARMRWRCRRGVRELDLLLERFLVDCYPALSRDQSRVFDALLDEPDLDILGWIMNRSQPSRPEYRPLLDRMREIRDRPIAGEPAEPR